jgi:hypothetical protein
MARRTHNPEDALTFELLGVPVKPDGINEIALL